MAMDYLAAGTDAFRKEFELTRASHKMEISGETNFIGTLRVRFSNLIAIFLLLPHDWVPCS
jgi:hypothetical protein